MWYTIVYHGVDPVAFGGPFDVATEGFKEFFSSFLVRCLAPRLVRVLTCLWAGHLDRDVQPGALLEPIHNRAHMHSACDD